MNEPRQLQLRLRVKQILLIPIALLIITLGLVSVYDYRTHVEMELLTTAQKELVEMEVLAIDLNTQHEEFEKALKRDTAVGHDVLQNHQLGIEMTTAKIQDLAREIKSLSPVAFSDVSVRTLVKIQARLRRVRSSYVEMVAAAEGLGSIASGKIGELHHGVLKLEEDVLQTSNPSLLSHLPMLEQNEKAYLSYREQRDYLKFLEGISSIKKEAKKELSGWNKAILLKDIEELQIQLKNVSYSFSTLGMGTAIGQSQALKKDVAAIKYGVSELSQILNKDLPNSLVALTSTLNTVLLILLVAIITLLVSIIAVEVTPGQNLTPLQKPVNQSDKLESSTIGGSMSNLVKIARDFTTMTANVKSNSEKLKSSTENLRKSIIRMKAVVRNEIVPKKIFREVDQLAGGVSEIDKRVTFELTTQLLKSDTRKDVVMRLMRKELVSNFIIVSEKERKS